MILALVLQGGEQVNHQPRPLRRVGHGAADLHRGFMELAVEFAEGAAVGAGEKGVPGGAGSGGERRRIGDGFTFMRKVSSVMTLSPALVRVEIGKAGREQVECQLPGPG